MDAESVISIVIFIFALGTSIISAAKKERAAKKAASAPAPAQPRQYSKGTKRQSAPKAQKAQGVENVIEALAARFPKQEPVVASTKAALPPLPEEGARVTAKHRDAAPAQIQSRKLVLDRENLRRAIILSEVLPPKF